MRNAPFTIVAICLSLLMTACQGKPKVIEAESVGAGEGGNAEPTALAIASQQAESDIHKVVVVETLNTERYTYLNVTEDDKNFWIAIPRKEVEVGGTYYYKGGLLKKNFFSQEFNRVFETVYLVSDVQQQPINGNGSALDEAMSNIQVGGTLNDGPIDVQPAEGAIAISTLMKDRQKYEGKTVKVTGKCVKVNPMIMGRNWVHIKDASSDTDLTVTTMENINLGAVVSLEGTIALNKDFGAGYRYDVIMESAVIK
ncbi:MAG TPA: GW dipeptide domain-containing protein [Flavilitoribacter sp.]|nr:GW dipeptide domain-containing protein [Flavilitoribacter sp.]